DAVDRQRRRVVQQALAFEDRHDPPRDRDERGDGDEEAQDELGALHATVPLFSAWSATGRYCMWREYTGRPRISGRSRPVNCEACRHENPAGARFCNECGARLAAPAIPLEPRSYTPRHLVEKILAQKSALEGERKLVTVL